MLSPVINLGICHRGKKKLRKKNIFQRLEGVNKIKKMWNCDNKRTPLPSLSLTPIGGLFFEAEGHVFRFIE